VSCRGAACSFLDLFPSAKLRLRGKPDIPQPSGDRVVAAVGFWIDGFRIDVLGRTDVAEVVSVAQASVMPIRWAVGRLSCAVGVWMYPLALILRIDIAAGVEIEAGRIPPG